MCFLGRCTAAHCRRAGGGAPHCRWEGACFRLYLERCVGLRKGPLLTGFEQRSMCRVWQQMGLGQIAAVWPACPAHASGVWRRATGAVPQLHLLHACAWTGGVICEVCCNFLRCYVCRLPPRRPKAPCLCSIRCTWHSSVLFARYSGRPHSAVRHWVSAGSLLHTARVVGGFTR